MDNIYNNAVNAVVKFAEKKVSELESQKDANIRLKQDAYKRETTDKRIAEIVAIRDKSLTELKASYDEQVKTINLAFENKKAQLIEEGNALVKAEEEMRFENGVKAIMQGIELLKGEIK